MIKYLCVILTILAINRCSPPQKPTQSILLFKDKDGIYEYYPTTGKEEIVYKATDAKIFLDEPYCLIQDTLTFGVEGKLTYIDTANYSAGKKYFKDYISVDLKTKRNWLSRKILYEVDGRTTLKIRTQIFNSKGVITFQSDSSTIFRGLSSTYKGITYNVFKPRFFSISTVGKKTVFSLRGNIYLVENGDTSKIVDYKGTFDPKFGSGYFEPQLDPTGQFAVFRYLPGFMNFTESPSLQKVELSTKHVEKIKKGFFSKPLFAKDGQFLLFKRNERQGKNDTRIYDIELLDLKTNHEWKIGEANAASWEE